MFEAIAELMYFTGKKDGLEGRRTSNASIFFGTHGRCQRTESVKVKLDQRDRDTNKGGQVSFGCVGPKGFFWKYVGACILKRDEGGGVEGVRWFARKRAA